MIQFVRELFRDDSGRPSLSKTILGACALIACVVIVKLTYMKELTPEYYLIFLSFATGHASMSKYLDKKGVNHNGDTPDPSGK